MEIERKFLLRKIPENLDSYPYHLIEQAYLCVTPVIRIRRQDDEYYLTYKGSGMMSREEYNLPLTKEAYEHLLPKSDGNVISKKRYLIPLSSEEINPECLSLLGDTALIIELDEFAPPLCDHMDPSFRRLNPSHLDSCQCIIQLLRHRPHLRHAAWKGNLSSMIHNPANRRNNRCRTT